jgi:hypothetical protein
MPSIEFAATDWTPHQRNTLQGFLTLHLPSGLSIRDCTYHKDAAGSEWVGLPSKPQLNVDGRQRRDPSGKALYTTILEIKDQVTRQRFRAAALSAVHKMLDGGQTDRTPPSRHRHGNVYSLPAKLPPAPPPADNRVDDLWTETER